MARYRPHPNVAWRAVTGEMVLVHLTTNRIYALNATSLRLWELLQPGREQGELVTLLTEEFDAADEDVAGQVERILSELAAEHLIVRDDVTG